MSLHLFVKCSHTFSMLRFPKLRAPKTTHFIITLSLWKGGGRKIKECKDFREFNDSDNPVTIPNFFNFSNLPPSPYV